MWRADDNQTLKMSWFQSANIASLAKTALKEAQKTIDKALDIREEDGQAQAGNAAEGGDGGRNVGVSAAVTDMASEFFASWGVTGGTTSSKKSPNLAGTASSSNASSKGSSPEKNRAISTPPRSSVNVNELRPVEKNVVHKHLRSSSDVVPVTLIASGGGDDDDGWGEKEILQPATVGSTEEQNSLGNVSNKHTKQHTRSLSDTVFHAPDDSVDNLGALVQVLDDSSTVVLDPDPILVASSSPTPIAERRHSPKIRHKVLSDEKSEKTRLSDSHSLSTSVELVGKNPEKNIIAKTEIDSGRTPSAVVEPSNLELLQEIDLDGNCSKIEQDTNNVVPLITSNVNSIESSALSDGWDWAASTDSCLISDEIILPVKTEEVKVTPDDNEDAKSTEPHEIQDPVVDTDSSAEHLEGSAETLKLEQDGEKTEVRDEEPVPVPLPAAPRSPTSNVVEQPPVELSSRPNSPALIEQDHEIGEGERTPPSSARVSPNFEMVSSGVCCVVSSSGGTHPESSRSSSIVVVSGRESTPNSRGTSGAGSSGSSEGGHDLVDGEIPHSPAANQGLSPGVEEFSRKVSKHKKGASSSSSSDIEVIPSDYSNSSAGMLSSHVKKEKPTFSDRECQTELQQQQFVECEVQTDELPVAVNPADVNPQDLSQFLSNEMADILAEKEQEAQQLREEGEKLSKKQFELSQAIKKLRAKEKDNEAVIKGLRTEVATKNLELEKLMKTFISKEGIEQSQNETISRLNQERRKLELRIEELTSELEDAKDNVESMKATVENASIEILELKNVISSVQRESAEVDRLTKEKGELISRTESLQKEVDHLRSALNSSQSSHQSREAELKSQISTLTHEVHQLETRLGDISSEVADATMPLSMEIEKLQTDLKQQISQADRREQAMQSTINDLETKLKAALESEKSAKDLEAHYQTQHSKLAIRVEELEEKNRSLVEQLHQKEEIYGKKIEDKVARCQKLEKTVERLTGEVERLASENDSLCNEMKLERANFELERRRLNQNLVMDNSSGGAGRENYSFQQQSQRQVPHHHQRSSSMSTTASSTGITHHRGTGRNDNSPRSREHSPSEHSIASEASYLDEVFDPSGNNGNRSMTPKSFFESFSSAGLIENLQSQLRHREGEVMAFQEELSKNEKIRRQLNEEIANLTMQNQQLSIEMEKLGEMEQKLEEVEKNYNAVLQMYGEKVEEADELRMDLEDVKEMYKAQIEQLLKKS